MSGKRLVGMLVNLANFYSRLTFKVGSAVMVSCVIALIMPSIISSEVRGMFLFGGSVLVIISRLFRIISNLYSRIMYKKLLDELEDIEEDEWGL